MSHVCPLARKRFTGQQDEGGAFGLYDYGARFYSTVTGQFLSADPLAQLADPQALDRYAYVLDNPLKYVDPTGLHATIVCGSFQQCEADRDENGRITKGPNMKTIESYKGWAMFYWYLHEHVPLDRLEAKWALFSAFVAYGHSPEEQLAAGQIAFVSTGNPASHGGYAPKVSALLQGHPEIDTAIGFSLGAHVLAEVLASGGYGSLQRAVLIEKADAFLGDPLNNHIPADVNIVTLNHQDAAGCILGACGDMTGETAGIVNITANAYPPGHGTFEQNADVVFFTLVAASDPMRFQGAYGDLVVQYSPVPVPAPAP